MPKDGVDRVNARDDNGNTPLMALLQQEDFTYNRAQQAKAALLLKFGALWTVPNVDGITPQIVYDTLEDKESIAYLKNLPSA